MSTNQTAKIALLVFQHIGHHSHFAHLAWQAFAKKAMVTIIAPKNVSNSEEFRRAFKDEGEELIYETSNLSEKEEFLRCSGSGVFTLVFSIAVDSYWHRLLLPLAFRKFTGRLRATIAGILIGASFAYPKNQFLRFKAVKCFLLRFIVPLVFHRLFLIDEMAYDQLFPNGHEKCRLLGDPIESLPDASSAMLREKHHLPQKGNIFLAIGAITTWKRFDLLLKNFLSCKLEKDDLLIIAGKFAPDQADLFQKILASSPNSQQVFLLNRWLDDSEINEWIVAADAIAVTYPHHFANASILFRAQMAGKKILLSDSGWLHKYQQKYNCGFTVNIEDSECYQRGVEWALHSENPNENITLQLFKHSEDAFRDQLRQNLFSDLPLGED